MIGELAALGTAALWGGSALSFEAAGRRVGSLSVNLIRLVMALVMLALLGLARRGLLLPTDASADAWAWLAVSGIVGFTFGDLFLFRALVLIGSRLSSLLMSLAPPFAALAGWLILGETMNLAQLGGMAMTVGGIALAIADRDQAEPTARPSLRGILFGIMGSVGQALGLVLSKLGMGDYDPFAATQIRVLAGIAGFAVVFTLARRWHRVRAAARHRHAMGFTAAGAFCGPFLGVSFSLLAVQHTQAGVAASIMATTPVLLIPVVVWTRGERVGVRAIFGTILAVAGVAVLSFQ